MSNNEYFEFSKNIFNDTGNGNIEFDVSDYNNDFNINLKELTQVLLICVLEDFVNGSTLPNTNAAHLKKKPRII